MKERERALRKRKEREEQEVERVRQKARRKEGVESYKALLVETIKDPQVYNRFLIVGKYIMVNVVFTIIKDVDSDKPIFRIVYRA